ncbi:GDSL-type esterase/lipase family protein [Brevibacillus humidisoli]|uniref:GDSL-type esterase/lipase family protein n=1 Tax=Brevibacillus humidisoli TaxID=2895522 RepID=UPI001E46FAA2|nr:GDSL-type esterase/lipase family protein [Brevibacillus humidisoli]UFJ41667.1 GDSL-type esterase/lipase family protein [Brevibacillus humidisoli]
MRRQSGQLLWPITGSIALLSLLLFACGFVFALNPHMLAADKPLTPTAEQAPANPDQTDNQWDIVALGDSLTRGTGDVNGQGYVGLFREAYEKETTHKIVLHNLAINGLTSTELLEQLEQKQVQQLLASADLILFTIGGNDLFRLSEGLYELDEETIDTALSHLEQNFVKVLAELRRHNPQATIVYTSLYNPFGNTEAAGATTKPLLQWNSTAQQTAAQFAKVLVVPTYDLFAQKEDAYLYTDHFHPNSAGYARIAERVLQAVD